MTLHPLRVDVIGEVFEFIPVAFVALIAAKDGNWRGFVFPENVKSRAPLISVSMRPRTF
jgi:hypothetical protein